ncbi:hypothetical protein Tco_1304627 [Tanacetum coccineum]
MPPFLLLSLSMPYDDCDRLYPYLGQTSQMAFKQMQSVFAAIAVFAVMVVFDPFCGLKKINVNRPKPSRLALNGVGIKRFHDDLEVIAAKIRVTTAKQNLVLLKDMDQDSAHIVGTSKVPMLKPGEYELWRMRMEQYIQMIDYSLWEVTENGNSVPKIKLVEGVEIIIAPTTAKEKAQRRLELKAKSTLFIGIPNEHQLMFNSIKDAKSLP